MTDAAETRGVGWAVVAFLLLVVAAGTADIILDRPAGLTPHVLVELLIVLLAAGMALFLARGWRRTRQTLVQRAAERDAWRERAESALAGMGLAMSQQLDVWGLTPAERDIAVQLVRGHSHKHIARVSGRSERTVRQHAIAVYHKAGVAGRAELAAFFLQDISLPPR